MCAWAMQLPSGNVMLYPRLFSIAHSPYGENYELNDVIRLTTAFNSRWLRGTIPYIQLPLILLVPQMLTKFREIVAVLGVQ